MAINKLLSFTANLLFPRLCLNCQKEEDYLCQDCRALLEISGFHQKRFDSNLEDLYFPLAYKNPLAQKLIRSFKYEPFVKGLAKTLAFLIISHFQLMDNKPDFYPKPGPQKEKPNFIIMPVPLDKKRLKWRGFNQAEEISKELAQFFKLPLASNCLVKIKQTKPQAELQREEKKENIQGAFLAKENNAIKNKNILLVDDVYTSGATMQECVKVLKKAGCKKIIGLVFARG